jgi:carboxypeptidase family protein
MSFRRFILSVLIFSLVLISSARAQTGAGSLSGQVTDQNNKSVADATVRLIDASTKGSRDTKTDSSGSYGFSQVRPGIYRLQIEAPNFKMFVQEKVEILISTPTTLNAALQLGAVTEEVVVSAEAMPTINTQDATVGDTFNEAHIKSLPFYARNVTGLLTLQPGVVFTGVSDLDRLSEGSLQGLDMREGAVNGVRGNQMNMTLDGGDSNDWQNHAAFTSSMPVTLDSLQEFRVTTAGANSTDGIASGPQISLVTKGGTDQFHGNVRWYYRTSGTSANNYFDNLNEIPRGRLTRNISGASIGGYLIKDRLFFFADFEDRQDRSDVLVSAQQVPSDALRDGALIYQCSDPSACPGGTVQGLTSSHAVPAGAMGLTPAQVKTIDPLGLGVNPAMLSYMTLFPHGNAPGQSNDDGLAFNALSFNAPADKSNNIYTARLDYNITRNGHHTAFVRGSLAGISDDLTPGNFPGQPVASTALNNSRGITVGYNAELTPNLINTLHYTFARLGEAESGSTSPAFSIRFFASNTAFNRGFSRTVPTNEVKDDLSWSHGKHTFQMGAGAIFIHNNRIDDTNSFAAFQANPGNCNDCGNLQNNLQNDFGLTDGQLPTDANLFNASYLMLTGSVNFAGATFFANPHTGQFLPAGTPDVRHFAQNDFNGYFQDNFKLKPNLNVVLGVRYEYMSPPWETNGFEVAPDVNIYNWFLQREEDAAAGIGSNASPLLGWNPAGKANGQYSWYQPNYANFSPHIGIAYSPGYSEGFLSRIFGGPGKSSIRAGAGIYYDQIGQSLAVQSDLAGSPGTSTNLSESTTGLGLSTAPRFSGTCSDSGCTGLPSLTSYFPAPASATFPFFPSTGTSTQAFGVDPHLRTPYVISLSLDWQREIGKGLVLDVGYVGTLGRRLLTKSDFAEALPLKDLASGMDIYQAFDKIVALGGTNKGFNIVANPNIAPDNFAQLQTIQTIPYFNDMMPNMPASLASFINTLAGFGITPGITPAQAATLTPTQAFYSFAFLDMQTSLGSPSWSCALFALDTGPTSGSLPVSSPWNKTLDPNGTGNVLYTPQFNGLGGWSNYGYSAYHSLQVGVRKSRGNATFAANYVFSKSLDNASSPENGDLNPGGNGAFNGLIYTPWDLRQNRSLSDFNVKHNFSGSFNYALPFGRGQHFGSSAGRIKNALIGNWEFSGLVRWRSGFPLSPSDGFNFPTDFFLSSPGAQVGSLSTQITRTGPSVAFIPNLFSNPQTALNSVGPVLPGFSGSRNVITGPAFADFDADINKTFHMPWSERELLKIRVSAYNVFNSVNFQDNVSLDPTIANTFGQFTNTIGNLQGGARQMEFAARFEF